MNIQAVQKGQANFFISLDVIEDLNDFVPARKRSEFVEAAIQKELKKQQFLNALEEASGGWKSKDHKKNTEDFIRSLRESKRNT